MNVNDCINALIDTCEKENIEVNEEDPKILEHNGLAVKLQGKRHILIKETLDGYEKLLTLAQLMANHIFGHVDKYGNRPLPYTAEDETKFFSVVYLAMAMFEATKAEREDIQQAVNPTSPHTEEIEQLNQICGMLREMSAQDKKEVLGYITKLKQKGVNDNGED